MDSILQLVTEKRLFLGRTREKVLSKARTHFKIFRKEVKKRPDKLLRSWYVPILFEKTFDEPISAFSYWEKYVLRNNARKNTFAISNTVQSYPQKKQQSRLSKQLRSCYGQLSIQITLSGHNPISCHWEKHLTSVENIEGTKLRKKQDGPSKSFRNTLRAASS